MRKLLTYCVFRSTQPPTLSGMGNEYTVVGYGLRGESLVWLFVAVVCPLAADRGSICSLTRAMDGRVMRVNQLLLLRL